MSPTTSSATPKRRRDDPRRLLRAATAAAERFIRARDWESAVDEVLTILGLATDVSRIYAFQVHHDAATVLVSQYAEWVNVDIEPQLDNPDLQNLDLHAAGFERWVRVLSQGEPIVGLVSEFPDSEVDILREQDIVSLAVTPVFADGAWWGFIGYDDCVEPRRWSEEEIDALKLAADLFGAAIARQRREDRERELVGRRQFYERTLNEIPLQIVVLDAQGRYAYINPHAVKDDELRAYLIGKTSRDYAEARGLDPDLFEERQAHIRRAIDTRERQDFEETMTGRDGEERHVHRVVEPILADDGTLDHVVSYSIDVTEQRRYEARLKQARDEAEALSRAKTTLLANMNHELRTPLTAIMGFAELLRGEVKDTAALDLIRTSGHRLTRTLDAILELAQLESGALEPTIAPVNLTQVVEEALGHVQKEAASKNIVLSFPDRERPIGAVTDRAIVGRLLRHLLENAVKFTPKGTVGVHLSVTPATATLRVTDTGVGMAEEDTNRITEAFWQASSGLNRTYEGNGLGLAIATRLLDLLGGSLSVESAPGEGSTFTIVIPRHPYAGGRPMR